MVSANGQSVCWKIKFGQTGIFERRIYHEKDNKETLFNLVLAVAMLLAFGVPVSVAAAEAEEAAVERGSSPYYDINVTMYNGVWVYTPSYPNTSGSVCVKLDASLIEYVNVAVFDSDKKKISGTDKTISTKGEKTISPAALYPNQYIRLGMYREDITGSYRVSGKFYYNW